MENVFKIILDASVPGENGNRILNFDSLQNQFEEAGYHHYVFGGYLHVYSKNELTDEQKQSYEKEAAEVTKELVDQLSKEINRRILDSMLEKDARKRNNNFKLHRIELCPENLLHDLYELRIKHVLDDLDEDFETYKIRYRCVMNELDIYCDENDNRWKIFEKAVNGGEPISIERLRSSLDAVKWEGKIIKNRFGYSENA